MLVARILGWSLFTAGLAAWLGYALFGKYSDWVGISVLLACVGGVIGAVAAAAQEIVTALRPGRTN